MLYIYVYDLFLLSVSEECRIKRTNPKKKRKETLFGHFLIEIVSKNKEWKRTKKLPYSWDYRNDTISVVSSFEVHCLKTYMYVNADAPIDHRYTKHTYLSIYMKYYILYVYTVCL